MARYINADKAMEIITEVIHDTVSENADVVASEVEYAFDSMPTEDVREVVLCKDCKYASSYGIEGTIFCEDMECPNLEDGFCNHAERRGDE